jgi:hypothetical protein
MMLDWDLYRKQITSTIGQIATMTPDIVRGYRAISDAGQKTGKLDGWQLLAFAMTRCD